MAETLHVHELSVMSQKNLACYRVLVEHSKHNASQTGSGAPPIIKIHSIHSLNSQ